ncbi:MAG TPA: Ni/Fe hydrogenase subunit alpha [Solirubrobacterales bacterium]|nr:Ni/Fe hydrogenase subunit alpha [Solirubrobacterales bacterium]
MPAEPPPGTRTIRTSALARVEGEGAMHVRIRGEQVEEVRLEIYEPPRFFEAFLRGRDFSEAPDITARICGICPVAYMTSAFNAIEDALEVRPSEAIRALRRLMYCGEWIESHALHVFMLHAPDFLGFESAWAMAREHPEVVEGGLEIKKAGNDLLRTIGGRAIHPVNVRVGGFYKAPRRAELEALVPQLEQARVLAHQSVRWVATLAFPDFEQDYEFVALRDPDLYAIEDGRLVSSSGLEIAPGEYEEHFVEEQVEHSTALHSRMRDGGTYFLGPMARYSLNSAQLSPLAREAAADAGLGEACRNPFKSIIVRAVEILYALDEALRLISTYEPPNPPAAEVEPRAAAGCGWSEAPRGMLWHRYRLEGDGSIAEVRIVPPTSQNQARVEQDLLEFVRPRVDLPDERLQWECEQAIRNYDPCISCSTHFLKLTVDR